MEIKPMANVILFEEQFSGKTKPIHYERSSIKKKHSGVLFSFSQIAKCLSK